VILGISEPRQARGEDFEFEIFLVPQAVSAALDDADFVVEAFDEAEGDFVFRLAIGGDAVPMFFDHLGKLLVRGKTLPAKLSFPVVKKLPRPDF